VQGTLLYICEKTFSGRCEEIHNCLTYMRIFCNAILPFSPTVQIWSPISNVYLDSICTLHSFTRWLIHRSGAHIRGRYWSAKKDDISLWPPDFTCLMKEAVCRQCIGGPRRCSSHCCRERARNRRGWISANNNNLSLQSPEKSDTVYTASQLGTLGPEEDSCKDVDNRYNPSRDNAVW
jgi:hypothetical protein